MNPLIPVVSASLGVLAIVSPASAQLSQPPISSSTPAGGAQNIGGCTEFLRDQSGGACIEASRVPRLGRLFPLSEMFNILSSGQVRIGTPVFESPGSSLLVEGVAAARRLHVTEPTPGNELSLRFGPESFGDEGIRSFTGIMQLVVGNRTQVTVQQDRLGVGDHLPAHSLDVRTNGDAVLNLAADEDNILETDHPQILMSQDGGVVRAGLGFFDGTNDFTLKNEFEFSDMVFSVDDTQSARSFEFVTVTNGVPDVEARLTAFGDWLIDGSVGSPAADVAEYYPTQAGLEPGDVVSFSGNGLELTAATPDNVARLAGVISSRPGVVLGINASHEEEGKIAPPEYSDNARLLGTGEFRIDQHVLHELEANGRGPLALVGRVPVKVTGEGGPIAIGDRLTLASISGHARRARSGETTFATALSEWSGGEGKVVALVGAQQAPTAAPLSHAAGRAIVPGAGSTWIELPAGLSRLRDGADLAIQLTSVGSFEPLALGRIDAGGFEVLSASNTTAFHWRAERVD